MDWFGLAQFFIRKIPVERILLPPKDNTKELQEFMTTFRATPEQEAAAASKPPALTAEKPKEVAYSGSPPVVTREGVDQERLAWQDGIIRAELWLLEGHLKNNCLGCGGDVECCFKHCQNVLDATRETQSMTTEPLYRETVSVAELVQPFVHPEAIKTGEYASRYPALTIEVSKVRTQFDKRVMGYAREPVTLEEAKEMAAEEAAKEVERQWYSPEKK